MFGIDFIIATIFIFTGWVLLFRFIKGQKARMLYRKYGQKAVKLKIALYLVLVLITIIYLRIFIFIER
ncbi:MAG: hypothetical protein AB1815_06130 [Bacillota bacterium]